MSPSKQTLCQVLFPAQCWAPSLNPICIWSLNKTWLHQQCISCIHQYNTLDLGHCHQMPHLLCVPGHTPVKDKKKPKIKSCCGNPETHWHLQIKETVIETSPFTLPSINKPQHTASTNPQSFQYLPVMGFTSQSLEVFAQPEILSTRKDWKKAHFYGIWSCLHKKNFNIH